MAARILGRIGGTGMRLGKALVTTPAGLATLGGLGCGHMVMQSYFGTATDFFEYSFETKQPPEKIVGTERGEEAASREELLASAHEIMREEAEAERLRE